MATRKSAAPKQPAPAATAQAADPRRAKAGVAQKAERRPSKSEVAGSSPAARSTGQRAGVDWDAIERDYRTDKFTLRELAAKYGVSHQAIQKRANTKGWTKDLAKAIKHATNVALVNQFVASEADKGGQEVAETVQIVAEMNKQVILGHRKDLKVANEVAVNLIAELANQSMLLQEQELLAQVLAGEGAEPVDVAQAQAAIAKALGLGNRGKTLKAIVDSLAVIQTRERIAFGLDEKDDDKDKDSVSQALADFFGGIHGAAAGRLSFAPATKA